MGNLTEQTLQLETKDGPVLHSEVAVDLVDELADRESRKCNLIVYNLSESSTPNAEADKSLFTRLCSSLSLQVHITAVTRLGKKEPSKTRPLRVCLDNEATKRRILSRSSQLKSKPDWENVKTTISNTPSATSRADQSTSVTTDVPPPTS